MSQSAEVSDWASLIYGLSFIVLIFLISIMIYVCDSPESPVDWAKQIWRLKSIYGALLVYVYDTATDVGVVFYFYYLAQDERNKGIDYESLNMDLMFTLSMIFLIVVRVIWLTYATYMLLLKVLFPPCYCMGSLCCDQQETIWYIFLLFFAAIMDGFVLLAAVGSIMNRDPVMSALQQQTSWIEAMLESTPQLIIQTVFIIRSQNDIILSQNQDAFYLVVLSIFGSILRFACMFVLILSISLHKNSKQCLHVQSKKIKQKIIVFLTSIQHPWMLCILYLKQMVHILV